MMIGLVLQIIDRAAYNLGATNEHRVAIYFAADYSSGGGIGESDGHIPPNAIPHLVAEFGRGW